jgi:hypothetical protein
MKIINTAICILFLLSTASCSNSSETAAFATQTNEFVVSAPPQVNSFRLDDFITVVVKNNSEHERSLAQDSIAILIGKDETTWIETKNLSHVREIILSPKSNHDYSLTAIVVLPDISNIIDAVTIRIVVTATNPATNAIYKGFVDVTLVP